MNVNKRRHAKSPFILIAAHLFLPPSSETPLSFLYISIYCTYIETCITLTSYSNAEAHFSASVVLRSNLTRSRCWLAVAMTSHFGSWEHWNGESANKQNVCCEKAVIIYGNLVVVVVLAVRSCSEWESASKQSHTLANKFFFFFWWEHKKCTQYIVVIMALQWVLIYAHIYGKYFYIFFVKDAKKVTAAGRYLCVWIYMYVQVYAYVALIGTSECLYEMISLYERH